MQLSEHYIRSRTPIWTLLVPSENPLKLDGLTDRCPLKRVFTYSSRARVLMLLWIFLVEATYERDRQTCFHIRIILILGLKSIMTVSKRIFTCIRRVDNRATCNFRYLLAWHRAILDNRLCINGCHCINGYRWLPIASVAVHCPSPFLNVFDHYATRIN